MLWILGIFGLLLALAPFLFGYSHHLIATITSMILGGAVMYTSLFEGTEENTGKVEYVITGVIGFGAILAPFLLGFEHIQIAMWISIGIGFLLTVFASFKLYFE